jgi:hypothetical protein
MGQPPLDRWRTFTHTIVWLTYIGTCLLLLSAAAFGLPTPVVVVLMFAEIGGAILLVRGLEDSQS